MQPEHLNLSPDAWNHLVRRGLLAPGITDPQAYMDRYHLNVSKAFANYVRRPLSELILTTTLLEIHESIFRNLHNNAGQFRQKPVTAGYSMPADVTRISIEMELRQHQVLALMVEVDIDPIITAAVFAHVRSKAIQPFIDGNKRSSRFQSNLMIYSVYGKIPRWLPENQYLAATKAAHFGDLTDLINMVRSSLGIPKLSNTYLSPFRIRPFLQGEGSHCENLPMASLFNLSRRKNY